MTIRTLSLIPLRSQPSTFSTNMEDLLSNLPGWTSEVNSLGEDVTAKQITASDAATTALTAIAGVNATKWVSGTTYALNVSVWSPLNFQPYRRKVAGAGTTDPSNDATNWAPLSVPSQPRMYYSARTSNTALGFDDFGKLIDITSGTFTQTFSACASLTNGWWCLYSNIGTGTITLESNGSETIDGLTNGVIPKGLYLIRCNGVALSTTLVGDKSNQAVLTSGTAWVCPMGVRSVKLFLVASGVGVTGRQIFHAGQLSGAAGEITVAVTPGTTYTYAVGAGSTGASSPSTFTAGGVTYSSSGGHGEVVIPGNYGQSPSTVQTAVTTGGTGHRGYGKGANGGYNNDTFSSVGGNGAIFLEY